MQLGVFIVHRAVGEILFVSQIMLFVILVISCLNMCPNVFISKSEFEHGVVVWSKLFLIVSVEIWPLYIVDILYQKLRLKQIIALDSFLYQIDQIVLKQMMIDMRVLMLYYVLYHDLD